MLNHCTPLAIVWIILMLVPMLASSARDLHPIVEIEEDVYSFTGADNGSSPMWCAGSTSLARTGGHVFASALETIPGAVPLNNCRWALFTRTDTGWERAHEDRGRTREPSPIAAFHDGRVFVSANPTLAKLDAYSGPAKPEIWQFRAGEAPVTPARILPEWSGSPRFSEHSYRSLACDGARGELVLFQNIDYGHAEWAFRDSDGKWSANGQIHWPRGDEYAKPKPVRLCYPNVALSDRAVHFFGVGDITEPNEAWRLHKEELTGKEWDYVFRRLYYSWSPDITNQPFHEWIEIANREQTAGHLWPCDLWLAPDGSAHLLWTERAIDERLRGKFFPKATQRHALHHAVLRDGKVIMQSTLMESTEANPGLVASRARFHVTPDNGLFVVFFVSGSEGGKAVSENRVARILSDGTMAPAVRLPLKNPMPRFFTATPRAGSPKSWLLEMFGPRGGRPNTMGYARVRLF